jgi:hypothetical protein
VSTLTTNLPPSFLSSLLPSPGDSYVITTSLLVRPGNLLTPATAASSIPISIHIGAEEGVVDIAAYNSYVLHWDMLEDGGGEAGKEERKEARNPNEWGLPMWQSYIDGGREGTSTRKKMGGFLTQMLQASGGNGFQRHVHPRRYFQDGGKGPGEGVGTREECTGTEDAEKEKEQTGVGSKKESDQDRLGVKGDGRGGGGGGRVEGEEEEEAEAGERIVLQTLLEVRLDVLTRNSSRKMRVWCQETERVPGSFLVLGAGEGKVNGTYFLHGFQGRAPWYMKEEEEGEEEEGERARVVLVRDEGWVRPSREGGGGAGRGGVSALGKLKHVGKSSVSDAVFGRFPSATSSHGGNAGHHGGQPAGLQTLRDPAPVERVLLPPLLPSPLPPSLPPSPPTHPPTGTDSSPHLAVSALPSYNSNSSLEGEAACFLTGAHPGPRTPEKKEVEARRSPPTGRPLSSSTTPSSSPPPSAASSYCCGGWCILSLERKAKALYFNRCRSRCPPPEGWEVVGEGERDREREKEKSLVVGPAPSLMAHGSKGGSGGVRRGGIGRGQMV